MKPEFPGKPEVPGEIARAYEVGRLRWSLGQALPALGLATAALVLVSWQAALLGVALFAVAAVASWIGGGYARGVRVGLVLGALPFVAAQLGPALGHACGAHACTPWCVAACACSGVVAGTFGGRWLVRDGGDLRSWAVVMAMVVGAGAMSCHCFGMSSVVALAATMALTSLPVLPKLWRT